MITYCKHNLQEIKVLVVSLNHEQYTHTSSLLSGATIGQHIRHITEFYLCLINGAKNGKVNYDQRERDLNLERDLTFAINTIDLICSRLAFLNSNSEMKLEGNFSANEGECITIGTTFKRELAYCLEHSIHHQALIKVGLIEQGIEHIISKNFGVAPSTIKHKQLI